MSLQQAPPPPPQLFVQETELARQFCAKFYEIFDRNRQDLLSLFRDSSTISFEGTTVTGGTNFLQRLNQIGLPAGQSHRIVTFDAQPCVIAEGALVVFVTGEYVSQQFSEVFLLVNSNGFYVNNSIFRVGNTNPFNVPEAAKNVAKAFIEHYFTTYDSNRGSLIALYRPNSCYTFEENRFKGPSAISEYLQTMPGVQHDSASIAADVHQVNGNQVLLVFVTGRLALRDESNPLNFTETFLLIQDGGSYYIGNHIFRLKYG